MGCFSSKLDKEEIVSRCKARKKYAKQLVKARNNFSRELRVYLQSLRATGTALLHFSNYEFLDPFGPCSSSATEEILVNMNTQTESEISADYSKVSESELSVVVLKKVKNFVEIAKELDEYFVKASEAGSHVLALLEVEDPVAAAGRKRAGKKTTKYVVDLSPFLFTLCFNPKSKVLEKPKGETIERDVGNASHSATIEKLYAFEKKLYNEVKNAESIKIDHEKRVTQLRKQESEGADYFKTEKSREEVESLETRMVVSSQEIETVSSEISSLRDNELCSQLLYLVKGLTNMWRTMYRCHQIQIHIAQQLKFLEDIFPGEGFTTDHHHRSTLRHEAEVQKWHSSFCNYFKSQRDYVHSLTNWIRLSNFQFNNIAPQNSLICAICEELHVSMDRIPEKMASDGIESFLASLHTIILQQIEEEKQKRRYEFTVKELKTKLSALKSLQSKHGSLSNENSSVSHVSSITKLRAKVEQLRAKVEEEKQKTENCASATRSMTLSSLKLGLPNVFQALAGFSKVCVQSLDSIYSQSKTSSHSFDAKKLLE